MLWFFNLKLDIDRLILYLLLPLGDLVARQRRAAPRAPGQDFVIFVEQAALLDLGQNPPDSFDVKILISNISIFLIQPKTDPIGKPLPLLFVLPHILPAPTVILGNTVLFDVLVKQAIK